MAVLNVLREWDEAKHPRGSDGKFTDIPGLETKWTKGKRKGISHNTMTASIGPKKAGHIRLTDEGREIDDLFVAPHARGKGVASKLLREAVSKYGHQTMRLHASPFGSGGLDAEGLQRLYAKHGFEPDPSAGKGHMIRKPDGQRGVAGGAESDESRRRKAKGFDNGELKEYWTKDPEGLAQWVGKRHPWTALFNQIHEYVKNEAFAKRIASAWYQEVFGHPPNQKKGRSADAAQTAPERINTPPFLSEVDGFTKGRPAMAEGLKDLTLEQCQAMLKQAMAEGDREKARLLTDKIIEMHGDRSAEPDGSDERNYGEGPGGSQKGISIKALKAQIKQATEDGDKDLVTKLKAKLAKLTGDEAEENSAAPTETDPDGARRSAMRSLPVIRSAYGSTATPTLAAVDEAERTTAPGGGVFVRASYRAGRDDEASDIMTLRFSAFNNWYEIDSAREGRFLERVAPGAFTKTIGERGGQVKILFNHGHDNQIGEKILGKIITLEERDDGAHAEIELFDTSYNRDLLPGLRSGAYGSSFMFNVMDDSWNDRPERSGSNPDGLPERTVRALRLLELGPVTWPANPSATAGMRSDTDTYCDGLRAARPETYNDVEERFAEFRSALPSTSVDEAVEVDQTEDTFEDVEAATRDDAPVDTDHAEDVQTNSAETRRARLRFHGVIEE